MDYKSKYKGLLLVEYELVMKVILYLCLLSTCSLWHLEALTEPGHHCMMSSHSTNHVVVSLKVFICSLKKKETKLVW